MIIILIIMNKKTVYKSPKHGDRNPFSGVQKSYVRRQMSEFGCTKIRNRKYTAINIKKV